MRILYVITELDRGGAEQALLQVARGVRDAGHEVAVAALFHADGAVGEELSAAGIPVYSLAKSARDGVGCVSGFRRLLRSFAPCLIHSWLFRANVLCRWFAPRDVVLVCSLRVRETRLAPILLERWAPRRFACCTCVSSDVAGFAERTLRIPAGAIRVIQNGVAFERFAPARSRSRPNERLVGLTVGRITPQKGIDVLIDALALLPEDLDWEWHFAGAEPAGRYARKLRSTVSEKGLEGRVDWHGAVAPDAIVDLLGQANLFALSSRWEGQPNAVLEAMAAGVPVLASACEGVEDLLQALPGCLDIVRTNTPEHWRKAIENLWSDGKRRAALSAAGLRLAGSRTWQQVAAQHLDIYTENVNTSSDGTRSL